MTIHEIENAIAELSISAEDLAAAWAYAEANPEEIQAAIRAHETA
jgi:uncharacterized protein (DUF433 family)